MSSAGVIFPKYAVTEPLMLAEQDEPEHMRARRLVNLSFMPRSVTQYSDAVQRSVHELMDGFIEDGQEARGGPPVLDEAVAEATDYGGDADERNDQARHRLTEVGAGNGGSHYSPSTAVRSALLPSR